MKMQSFFLLAGVCALAIIAQFILTDTPHASHQQASMLSTFNSQVSTGKYSEKYLGSSFNYELEKYNLYSYSDEFIGNAIWLNRKSQKIKAKYFAFKDGNRTVIERFNSWKNGKNLVLFCSGAYTTSDYSAPVGLTIDNGNIVNKSIDGTMDALVMVEGVGGVRISDLDLGSFTIQSLGLSIDPRNSFQLQKLIDWAAKEGASLFQTNLLCYKNTLKCGNVPSTASRRILAIVTSNDNTIYHVLFNISSEVSLTDAAKSIHEHLINDKRMSIVGMINLDTGSKDIFKLYDENGAENQYIKGAQNDAEPSNLIVYYYE